MLLAVLLANLRDAVAVRNRFGRVLRLDPPRGAPLPAPPVRVQDLGHLFRIFRPGGRRSSRCSCAQLHDELVRTERTVLMARDITGQQWSRERLAYLLPLLDHTEDAIVANDAEWHIVAWNKGAERMFGWTAEDALGGELGSFMQIDMTDAQHAEVRRKIGEQGRWRGETVVARKDGSSLSVESINVAIRDERGGITGYLGIHRDITERKRAEAQLRYHASLLQNMQDAVLATDDEFVLTAWNRGAERMFGWSAQEAVGRRVYELIPTSFSAEEMAAQLAALRETGVWRGIATWYGKHGTPVEAEGLTTALRSRQGQATSYLSIMRDLTERRGAQRALEARTRQQALLAELTLRNLVHGGLQALLDDAAALVARTLELELAMVGEKLPAGGIGWRATYGWSKEAIAQAPTSPADARSLVGYTLLTEEPVTSEDVRSDERFRISELLAMSDPVGAMAVVIPGEHEPFGVLVAAAQHRRRAFSSEDVNFTKAVANVIGVAAERARIAQRMEEVGESVRVRIARDLHDDALRELTDVLALAAVARSASVAQDETARWDEVVGALQRVGQHLRGAVYDLRLTADTDRDFADLLSDLVELQAGKAAGRRIELHGREALPPGSLGHRGTELVRIVREALTNARLHSGAGTIVLDASRSTRDCLRIEISDDGDWPDREIATSNRPGTGIIGMLERAAELGAVLRIKGGRTGGTSVFLELALGASEAGR